MTMVSGIKNLCTVHAPVRRTIEMDGDEKIRSFFSRKVATIPKTDHTVIGSSHFDPNIHTRRQQIAQLQPYIQRQVFFSQAPISYSANVGAAVSRIYHYYETVVTHAKDSY